VEFGDQHSGRAVCATDVNWWTKYLLADADRKRKAHGLYGKTETGMAYGAWMVSGLTFWASNYSYLFAISNSRHAFWWADALRPYSRWDDWCAGGQRQSRPYSAYLLLCVSLPWVIDGPFDELS
jgi:hypothetical protein